MPRGSRPDQPTPTPSRSSRSTSTRKGTPRKAGPLGPDASAPGRVAQVAAEIRRAVQSEIGRGLNDPRVQGIVSVTEVEVSPDGSEARIRVSVLPAERASLTMSGLRAAAGFLRRRVMDETRIGRVPRLTFEVDERLKRQSALDAALRATGDSPPASGAGDEAGLPGSAGSGPARNGSEENRTR